MKKNLWKYYVVLFGILASTSSCSTTGLGKRNLTSPTGSTELLQSSMSPPEAQDPFSLPVRMSLKGEYLKAILIAEKSFQTEGSIPEAKKRLSNYVIEIREDKNFFYILFEAKRLTNEKELDGGESELGKDVMFVIRQNDYLLVKRRFFK